MKGLGWESPCRPILSSSSECGDDLSSSATRSLWQTEGRERASKLMLRVGSGVERLGKMTITAQSSTPHPLLREHLLSHLRSSFPLGFFILKPPKLSFQHRDHKLCVSTSPKSQICQSEMKVEADPFRRTLKRFAESPFSVAQIDLKKPLLWVSTLSIGPPSWLICAQEANAGELVKVNAIYETGELFELGVQLSYLLLLLALLGVGSFFVIRQVLVRRELDLSAKELQEQVRSGDASATGLFELGAVMLRRKFYPAATKYLLQAIEKWDGDDQDLAQVYNALGVSYVRDGKTEKGIAQFEMAVKLQPGYVTAWNNLGDAYEKKKDLNSALKAFEEVLLFDPNNKVARPRRDALKEKVTMYKGVPLKSKKR